MDSVWIQKEFQLKARSRGFHLITREIEAALPELGEISVGLINLFIQHTSASLTILYGKAFFQVHSRKFSLL